MREIAKQNENAARQFRMRADHCEKCGNLLPERGTAALKRKNNGDILTKYDYTLTDTAVVAP